MHSGSTPAAFTTIFLSIPPLNTRFRLFKILLDIMQLKCTIFIKDDYDGQNPYKEIFEASLQKGCL